MSLPSSPEKLYAKRCIDCRGQGWHLQMGGSRLDCRPCNGTGLEPQSVDAERWWALYWHLINNTTFTEDDCAKKADKALAEYQKRFGDESEENNEPV